MRYIRTKDGIYEIESDYLNNKGVRVGYNVVGQEEVVLIENNNIIQADSIEELVDEFVLFDKHFNTYGMFDKKVINYKWLKEHITIYPSKLCVIYGAIWTSKGLIYVAKLNKKGELELI